MDAESKLRVLTPGANNTRVHVGRIALKRKKVKFEPEGSKFGRRADSLALQMAEKHEAYPSTQKLTEFRETIEAGSASSRRKFNLEVFRVNYTMDEYDCLPIEAQEYYSVDDASQFGKRIPLWENILIVGYLALVAASNQITYDDLLAIRSDEVEDKLFGNPLARTLENLGRILNQRSPESSAREAVKPQEAKEAKAVQNLVTHGHSKQITISTSDSSLPRHPVTTPSITQKRSLSNTSFEPRSTESTPIKLVKPETDIQQLQNDLVGDVLSALYGKVHIKVTWPRGRKLNLCYER
jgi:hypothetical protein